MNIVTTVPLECRWSDGSHSSGRRPLVIRVRAEEEQFLLSCSTVETYLNWMEALNAAIAVALPIDQRSYPRCRTLPINRRRPRATTNVVREQEQLLAPHLSPELLENDGGRQRRGSAVAVSRERSRPRSHTTSLTAAETSAGTAAAEAEAASPEAPSCPVARRLVAKLSSVRRGRSGSDEVEKHSSKPGKCESRRRREWPLRVDSLENGQPRRGALPSTSPPSRSHQDELPKYGEGDGAPLNPSTIDDHDHDDQHRQKMGDEKWRPDRSGSWTQAQATEYAQRCLLVMYEYSPRRHDVIVKDGNWWRIDWETETLRGCRPVASR